MAWAFLPTTEPGGLCEPVGSYELERVEVQ